MTFRRTKWTVSRFFSSRWTHNYCLVPHPTLWELKSAIKERPRPLRNRLQVLAFSFKLDNCTLVKTFENIFLMLRNELNWSFGHSLCMPASLKETFRVTKSIMSIMGEKKNSANQPANQHVANIDFVNGNLKSVYFPSLSEIFEDQTGQINFKYSFLFCFSQGISIPALMLLKCYKMGKGKRHISKRN